MTAVSSALQPQAATLGKYRLIAELGRGGMASVFLAVLSGPAGFSKLIVVKEIRPELADDPEFLAMFLDEARLSARLSHPNIVQTNEVGHDGDRYFIAMEYLDGQPYSRLISRTREHPLPLAAHLRILADVLSALHHAHELCDYDGAHLGVVHRDATPQNVFVTYDGQVKLMDFGIAKAVTSTSETATGVMKGKVTYMAPEQARGELVDRRADLFSVGVMLWEAIANRRMWKGVNDLVVLQRLGAGALPPIEEAAPHVPPRLAAIVRRALARSVGERFDTALGMRAELEGVLDELGDPTGPRDVGRVLAEAFVEHRATLRGVIEKQLASLRAHRATQLDALPRVEPLLASDARGSVRDDSARDTSAPASGTRSTSMVAGPPPSASPRGATTPILVALGTALLVGGGLALFPSAPPRPVVAPSPGATAVTAYTLTLSSAPSGASVKEGERFLGSTPVSLPFAPDQRSTRTFVLEMPGFVAQTLTQEPLHSNEHLAVTLLPDAPPPSPLASTPPRPAARVPSSPTSSAAPPTPDKLPIRTKR